MSKPYDMFEQLAKGELAEAHIDRFYAGIFHTTPATRAEQRTGIDRHYTHKETGKSHTIEIKTDWTATRTGNAFIETTSVDTMDIPGWAYSSQAEWLFYYLPDQNELCVITFAALRQQLPDWIDEYPERVARNATYHTKGILVPLAVFKIHCAIIRELPPLP
jgi:hypothetical protein